MTEGQVVQLSGLTSQQVQKLVQVALRLWGGAVEVTIINPTAKKKQQDAVRAARYRHAKKRDEEGEPVTQKSVTPELKRIKETPTRSRAIHAPTELNGVSTKQDGTVTPSEIVPQVLSGGVGERACFWGPDEMSVRIKDLAMWWYEKTGEYAKAQDCRDLAALDVPSVDLMLLLDARWESAKAPVVSLNYFWAAAIDRQHELRKQGLRLPGQAQGMKSARDLLTTLLEAPAVAG